MSNSLQPHGLYSPWNSPGQNTGVGNLSLFQGIFWTQGLNLGLPHCRQILYQLSHKETPRILEWVAYPFFRGSSRPMKRTTVSCIASGFFTNWAIREPHLKILHNSTSTFLQKLSIMSDLKKISGIDSQYYISQFMLINIDLITSGVSDDKERNCLQWRRPGFTPWSGRSPGEGNDYPLLNSCLENSMDRGAWWATVHGVAKSQVWLSD